MSFDQYLVEDARLVILRELKAQLDGRLNDTLITRALEIYGHRRSREWVRTQLLVLKDVGALALTEAGTVMVAELLRPGIDHVERRAQLAGVAVPSPGA